MSTSSIGPKISVSPTPQPVSSSTITPTTAVSTSAINAANTPSEPIPPLLSHKIATGRILSTLQKASQRFFYEISNRRLFRLAPINIRIAMNRTEKNFPEKN